MNDEIPTIELHVRKAELFKALGHPIRVRVLELLQGNELSVSMMLAAIAVEPSTLSTHLAVLRRADVVATSREGTTVTYRLANPAVAQFLAAAREFLIGTLLRDSSLLNALELEAVAAATK